MECILNKNFCNGRCNVLWRYLNGHPINKILHSKKHRSRDTFWPSHRKWCSGAPTLQHEEGKPADQAVSVVFQRPQKPVFTMTLLTSLCILLIAVTLKPRLCAAWTEPQACLYVRNAPGIQLFPYYKWLQSGKQRDGRGGWMAQGSKNELTALDSLNR